MSHRSNRYFLLPLLALCMTFAGSAPVRAQGGATATLHVNFGSQPRWSSIHGTRVREMRSAQRPGYDVYQYGGTYYAYNNDRWYSSRTGRGQYNAIDERAVPREFTKIPRDHWQHYPSAWMDQNTRDNRRRHGGTSNPPDNGYNHR